VTIEYGPVMASNISLLYSDAYPESAAVTSTINFSVDEAIEAYLTTQKTSLTAGNTTLIKHSTIRDVFTALSNTPDRVVAVIPLENSECGSFKSMYDALIALSVTIIGEFSQRTTIPPSNDAVTPVINDTEFDDIVIWTRYVLVTHKASTILASLLPAYGTAPSTASSLPSSTSLTYATGAAALKSSAVMSLSNEAGSVFKILSCFAHRNVSVLKFEMRAQTNKPFAHATHAPLNSTAPRGTTPASTPRQSMTLQSPYSRPSHKWSYVFFVDYQPPADNAVTERLIANLREFSLKFIELGTYKQNLTYDADTQRAHLLLGC